MAPSELTFLSAASMREQIRQKKLSPVELMDAHLEQIERLNPQLNAFVHVNAERARRGARDAEEKIMRGEPCGSLHGIPVSIKSSIAVAGMPFEAGTRLRTGCVAEHDAVLVQRLRAAGAIILGVTNTPELLMAWETDNRLYGRTNNPWDLSRTAGGSSGGEAAAIASGCSAGGVGSDGGGSIRVPAHFSGICGLKPTPGRIPSSGHFPASAGPFAMIGVVGPMARTVADLKLLFEAMQGAHWDDTCAAPVSPRWPVNEELNKIHIGYFEDDGRTPVTAETRSAVRKASRFLQQAGFRVQPFRPEGLEEVRKVWWQFFGIAGGMLLRPMVVGREADISPLLREFLDWVAAEPVHTGDSLLEAWVQRDLLRARLFAQMRDFPVLLCPVAAIPAFRHGERTWRVEGQTVSYLDAWSYTEWFNLLGTPAVSVPVGESSDGLPIGIQLIARPWQEEVLLSIAEALDEKRGAWRRPPV
jgi:Asp-tRNA(Asn)/Glu-tRNA(Gln) amidotransferase A subunit family amidase